MSEAELRTMILNFRVSDLVVLLSFAGRNKSGKKQELQSRALDLLKLKSSAVQHKIQELHNRRYNNQLVARPSNYDMLERPHSDRPPHHYDSHVNSSYPNHYNTNVRPPVSQHPSTGYPVAKSYIPPPPLSSSNSIPHYSSYVDVKFKDLPFFDVLYEIQKPSNLVNSTNDRYQETTFYFTLTSQQANDIALSRNASGNYDCQILLRFCLSESATEQEDNFPPSICVKVNGKLVPLPNPIPTNRPGVEPKRPSKPVNITALSKLAPSITNMITISWSFTYGRSYVFGIYVAKQLTSSTLLYRLKSAGIRNAEYTTAMIREKLQEGQDCEIATTSLRGSLLCPLGKIKMELPCRATTCTHIQCFDASLYIQMNEKKPKWICPVCDKSALFKTLVLDGLFMDISSRVSPEVTEVQFNEDGSWTPIMPKKEVKETPKASEESGAKKKTKSVEIVDLSDNDSEEEAWNKSLSKETTKDLQTPATPKSATPPLIFLSPDTPVTTSNSYIPTSTNRLSPYPESLAVSNIMSDTYDPLCILPDSSVPSTSSTSSGLSTPQYPIIPYLDNPYSSYNDQIETNENQSAYNNFDFFSLLNTPEGELDKGKDSDRVHSTPDVISLD
ncbi:E3 SUMO-protein ligase PIAS2 [Parasteatoda tepidariorum]|nr:E3 SUMO-protein ligase PIAS2 [Parasteatoda tepidariorum]